MSSAYIPIHLRKRQTKNAHTHSALAEPVSFEEEFPDMSFLTTSENDNSSRDNTTPDYIGIANNIVDVPKGPPPLPCGWKKLTPNHYHIIDGKRVCAKPGTTLAWEERVMEERYQKGIQYMEYIQKDHDAFVDRFIDDHGYSEYMRLYHVEFPQDASEDEDDEYIDWSHVESEEEDEY
jgi:hypothetical protein